jgi:cadmium resistance transport/sequestration family protein
MSWWIEKLSVAIVGFAATNIDDIIVLLIFFGQTNRDFRPKHILIGQYLGFILVILASLPGFFGGLVIPKVWIGLLGFLPIAIGVNHLLKAKNQTTDIESVTTDFRHSQKSGLAQIFKVAAVTFANGGDNIGVYVPLFASSDLVSLGVTLGIFMIGVGVWCYIAYLLTRKPAIALLLSRYGHRVVPFVLIGLGLHIIIESETYRLLAQLFPNFKA